MPQAPLITPYAVPNSNQHEWGGQESREKPFRQQTSGACEPEGATCAGGFKPIGFYEDRPCICDPCGKPVIENGLARHPHQVRREQNQDGGPTCCFGGGQVSSEFVDRPEEQKC